MNIITIVSTPCFELSDDDFESESNELELACFDAELYSILFDKITKKYKNELNWNFSKHKENANKKMYVKYTTTVRISGL